MLPTPTRYTLTSGHAEGINELTAFDVALIDAGIGNLNLVRVTSIIPPAAVYQERLEIPRGSLVPTAYSVITSNMPGERIAAGVGVATAADGFGVIMEYSLKGQAADADATLRQMLTGAFLVRGLTMDQMMIRTAEHRVDRHGCAVAAVPLWY